MDTMLIAPSLAQELAEIPAWDNSAVYGLAISLTLVAAFVALFRIRVSILKKQRRTLEQRVRERTLEIEEANRLLAEKQKEISAQNEELRRHREHLEQMIEERTRELMQAKLRAEESDRLKSSFIDNMSHEIRTPMNAIIGFSALLGDANISDEERDEFVGVISSNGRALLALIDDILDVSKIQSDDVELLPERIQVRDTLSELRDLYCEAANPGVSIELVDEEKMGDVVLFADLESLRQALSHLLGNACKYTERGSIRIACRSGEDEAVFEVADTGIGIARSEQGRIFEHFYKVEGEGLRRFSGIGVGLSICRRLAQMMGGRVWVESQLGEGSRFFLAVPLGVDPASDSTGACLSGQSVGSGCAALGVLPNLEATD